MKNYFALIITLLLMSCSSDDSATLVNTPSGALTKVKAYFPTTDVNYNSDYVYGSNGKISTATSTSIQPGFDNSTSTVTHLFNSEGQIWKTIWPNLSYEYQFSNGLIVSSIQTNIPSGIIKTHEYTYNNNNELIKAEYFDENGVSGAVITYTYDPNGNILTRNLSTISGSNQSYVFEYDTNYNPMSTLYENQAFEKISEVTPNNWIKRTYNNNGTINVFTTEYTYNLDGYPITKKDYQNVTTLVEETTFTYQQ